MAHSAPRAWARCRSTDRRLRSSTHYDTRASTCATFPPHPNASWRPRLSNMRLTLKGTRTRLAVHPMKRLLDVLREDCGLTGTKEGCGEGECGACTILIDGAPVNSCLVPLGQADGSKVTTIEGLNSRHPLQRAFIEYGGAQCGICTPGMIMAAVALGPKPSMAEMQSGLAGNLGRCPGASAVFRI